MKVLLSTYNGERWLDELLQSVRDQTFTEWTMLVRDDASTDRTNEILRNHAREDPRIQLVGAESSSGSRAPLGAAESFFSLLHHVELDEPFAFCDQDDVWFPHKLEWSLDALSQTSEPIAAVATDAEIASADLAPISPSVLRQHGFSPDVAGADLLGRLLLNNVVVGATLVGTGRLAQTARELHTTRTVTDPVFHDWWCALVAAYAGELIIVAAPTMAWRRHGANATGDRPANATKRTERRLRYFAWSVDTARTLRDGVEATTSNHKHVVSALAAVDLTAPRAAQLAGAWRRGARPWTTQHHLSLAAALASNLRAGRR